MVSIIAKEVFNETITNATFPDGDRLRDLEFSTGSVDVSSIIGGFAYIETINAETIFSNSSIPIVNLSGYTSHNTNVRPSYTFDSSLDLVVGTNITTTQDNIGAGSSSNPKNGSHDGNGEGSETLDIYVDTPATMSATVNFSAGGSVNIRNGTHTSDITVKMSVIGRTP